MVQKEDAWLFVEHMIVNHNNVDAAASQYLDIDWLEGDRVLVTHPAPIHHNRLAGHV
jgi:hypothetical protein